MVGQPEIRLLREQTLARFLNSLCSVGFFQASSANVTVYFFTVFNVRNFLYVYLESSSRLTVRVAYVVTRSLTLAANITYSGHIETSD